MEWQPLSLTTGHGGDGGDLIIIAIIIAISIAPSIGAVPYKITSIQCTSVTLCLH